MHHVINSCTNMSKIYGDKDAKSCTTWSFPSYGEDASVDGPFSQGKPTAAWCRRSMHRKSNGRVLSKTLYTTHNAEPRLHRNIITRNYFENWRRQKCLSYKRIPRHPHFSLEINWKSQFARGMLQSLSRKDHSLSPTNPQYDQETFFRIFYFLF